MIPTPNDSAAAGAAVTAQAATKTADVIAQIGAMTPAEQDQLNELGGAVDAEVQVRLAAANQRTLGSLLVIALSAIAGGVIILVGIVSKTASAENYKELIASVQPGTIIVAVIAALGGIAAGVKLGNDK